MASIPLGLSIAGATFGDRIVLQPQSVPYFQNEQMIQPESHEIDDNNNLSAAYLKRLTEVLQSRPVSALVALKVKNSDSSKVRRQIASKNGVRRDMFHYTRDYAKSTVAIWGEQPALSALNQQHKAIDCTPTPALQHFKQLDPNTPLLQLSNEDAVAYFTSREKSRQDWVFKERDELQQKLCHVIRDTYQHARTNVEDEAAQKKAAMIYAVLFTPQSDDLSVHEQYNRAIAIIKSNDWTQFTVGFFRPMRPFITKKSLEQTIRKEQDKEFNRVIQRAIKLVKLNLVMHMPRFNKTLQPKVSRQQCFNKQ